MRRHENFPKYIKLFSFVCHSLFRLFTTSMRKNRKTPFEIFPRRCTILVTTRWPGLGNRSVHWIESKFPNSLGKEKESFELFGRHTRRCGEKIESLPSLFIDRFRMCWSWANNIPLLVPDRYVKNWSGWWWGDYYEVRHYFCTRQKHQGKHYLAKTVKDDTRVGSSPLRLLYP